jgi:deoxyribodipyrimidine photo-lyase
VDWAAAAASARERIWGLREQEGFAALADAIQQRHCSRRSGIQRASSRAKATRLKAAGQLSLDLV